MLYQLSINTIPWTFGPKADFGVLGWYRLWDGKGYLLFSMYNCDIKVMHIPFKINMFETRTFSFLIKQNYICIKCKWRNNPSRLKLRISQLGHNYILIGSRFLFYYCNNLHKWKILPTFIFKNVHISSSWKL